MAVEDYKPGRLEYPIDEKDRYNAKIQFEIIETPAPEYTADLRSVLNWTEEDRTEARSSNDKLVKAAKPRATGKKVDLYIPQAHTLTDVFSYNNAASLGLSGAAFGAAMGAGQGVDTAIIDAAKQGFKGINDLLDVFGGKSLGQAAAVRAAAAAPIPQGLKDAIGLTARASIHPNLRTTFQNVGIRQFSFNFKFLPRSAEEARDVKTIIEFFRYHAYPEEIPGGLTNANITVPIAYKYPDMFRVKLFAKDLETNRYIATGNKMLDCFVQSISVTVNPTAAVYHADGEPVETDMTIQLVEHRPLARSDINKPLGTLNNEAVEQQSGSF